MSSGLAPPVLKQVTDWCLKVKLAWEIAPDGNASGCDPEHSDSGAYDWRPWTVPNHSGLVASPANIKRSFAGSGERAHIVGT